MVCVLTRGELRAIHALARRLEARGLVEESKTLRGIIDASSARREVSASVAADLLHVTSQTIRNWVKAGLLEGRVDRSGHFFVNVDALRPALDLAASKPHVPAHLAEISDEAINAEIKAHRAERRAAAGQ